MLCSLCPTKPALFRKLSLCCISKSHSSQSSSIPALGRWGESPPDLRSIGMINCEIKEARWLCHPGDSWYTTPSSVWLHLPHTSLLYGASSSSWTFDNARTKEAWDSTREKKSVWIHLPTTFSELQGNVDLHQTILYQFLKWINKQSYDLQIN